MEDLNKLFQLSDDYPMQLEEMAEEFMLKLRVILWGQEAIIANKEKLKGLPAASPQQMKKRVKRLSSLNEEVEDKLETALTEGKHKNKSSPKKSARSSTEFLEADKSVIDVNIAKNLPVPAPRTERGNISTVKKENSGNSAEDLRKSEASNLMPPPSHAEETLRTRPQRAAKLKIEKNLKEQPLKTKLRRPTEQAQIKLEHEQRISQMHQSTVITKVLQESQLKEPVVNSSASTQKSDDSILIIPEKHCTIVSIHSDIDDLTTVDINKDQTSEEQTEAIAHPVDTSGAREVRVMIKREKMSIENKENINDSLSDNAVFKTPIVPPLALNRNDTTSAEESIASSILSTVTDSTTAAIAKKGRKKKIVLHRPIKVERFSDLDSKASPVSSRTRRGTVNKSDESENSPNREDKRLASVYEDAVNMPAPYNAKEINKGDEKNSFVNETVNLGPSNDATMNLGPVAGDATFLTNQVASGQCTFVVDSNLNSTVTLSKNCALGTSADATFNIQQISSVSKDKDDEVGQRSFKTAKDSSMPTSGSLLTEDEEEKSEVTEPKIASASIKAKGITPKAAYKLPKSTKELFNPLVQSPVKMRVEAFENVAAAATEQSKRLLRNKKENLTPTQSVLTPVIGKLTAPTLGRFLTPTQSSNMVSTNSSIGKKVTSASKALPITKSISASSLYRSNSTTLVKNLQRENSAEEFRKGLQSAAEERKKLREQKHLLAAQMREAKERERAERVAKLAKEREEKRTLKKQQENDQKKRELEEIQRKLRQQQEEAAKIKEAKEREMLMHMKQQQQFNKHKFMPPPAKTASKYVFEMLHEDDSTDDEDKVSYKRPSPPSWSRRHARGPLMLKQEHTPTPYIDSFFSVQPMTPDLKIIFPNIDARYLKRNSSVLWSTPPRYSELPKY